MPGRCGHAVVTLTGTTNSLNLGTLIDALGVESADATCIILDLQPLGANAGIVYIGGRRAGSVTTSNYGARLEIPVTTIPQAPYRWFGDFRGPGMFSDVLLTGTNNDKVSVFYQLDV